MARRVARERYRSERLEVLVDLMNDPIVVGCVRIVIGSCLSHGIKMQGGTQQFQEFIDKHYHMFAQDAVRCMIFCGFVPWRLVRMKGGKRIVPEVLALGSFDWEVDDILPNIPQGVKLSLRGAAQIDMKDVHVYVSNKPNIDGKAHSTPLQPLVRSYEMLLDAEERQIQSDLWNTKARLFLSHMEKQNVYKLNEGGAITSEYAAGRCDGMFDDGPAGDEVEYQARKARLHLSLETEGDHEHIPDGYTLPSNSKLESMPRLQPVMNVEYLRKTFTAQVASVMGVPYEMIAGGYSAEHSGKRSLENHRYFVSNMQETCKHLEHILADVYTASFKGAHGVFVVNAVPRIEITTVAEVLQLAQGGLIDLAHAKSLMGQLTGATSSKRPRI